MHTPEVGNLYRIGDADVFCIIVYKYAVHKEEVLVAIFREKPSEWRDEEVIGLMHSFYQPMDEGMWQFVGKLPLPDLVHLTCRHHAGSVYLGDAKICKLPGSHARRIPGHVTPYFGAFASVAAQLKTGELTTKLAERVRRETEELLSGRAHSVVKELT